MKTYTIHTEAVTRSKGRRSMDHIIEAESLEDARYEARMRHYRRVGWNTTICIVTEQVA